MTDTMKAAVRTEFGPPEVVRVGEVPKPDLVDDGVLVRVKAVSVNPAEWYALTGPWFARGSLGWRRPKNPVFGADFSGIVEAVGKDISHVSVGDRVFGGRTGAFAEYLVVKNAIARIPDEVSFEEAAAVGTAAITALQGLRDHGDLQAGQRVLINGASGGVGTYAVQIAKALGATVTGVCRTHNVEMVRSLGADHVVDYTKEDFSRSGDRYDLFLDIAGSRKWSDMRRVLAPGGTVIVVGAPKGGLLGPLSHFISVKLGATLTRERTKFFIAKFNRPDMEYLAELMETGEMRSVIDKQFQGLEQIPDALRYLGEGHARAKVVISI